MSELERLVAELPCLRIRAQRLSVGEAADWSTNEVSRISSEIRWCVEALTELDARIKAVASQHQLVVR